MKNKQFDCVYVACHKGDYRYAKICVASIRQWHPDLPITLLTDTYRGNFSTRDTEKYWNVNKRPTSQPFGSPFSKLDPLLDAPGKRFLILDADTCLANKLPHELLDFDADFILQRGFAAKPEDTIPLYFDITALQKIDPKYRFPGFCVNTGQFFAKSGIITKDLLNEFVNWDLRPVNSIDKNLFRMNEESILNYLWSSPSRLGNTNIHYHDFWEWSESITDLRAFTKPLIHWAGATKPFLKQMTHFALLDKFERIYYSRIPLGRLKRIIDTSKHSIPRAARSIKTNLTLKLNTKRLK